MRNKDFLIDKVWRWYLKGASVLSFFFLLRDAERDQEPIILPTDGDIDKELGKREIVLRHGYCPNELANTAALLDYIEVKLSLAWFITKHACLLQKRKKLAYERFHAQEEAEAEAVSVALWIRDVPNVHDMYQNLSWLLCRHMKCKDIR